MAKAVVLLFLLDSLPDFNNVINTTLHTFAPGLIGVTCDSKLADPILQMIGIKKLDLPPDTEDTLQNIELPNPHHASHKLQELSPESLNNIQSIGNSIQESNEVSVEKPSLNFIAHNYIENATKKADIDVSVIGLNRTGNVSIARYPESAPFLAAIFETVGSVTAQTCGGVLLSRRWVLSAASCVNVLGAIYSGNSSNETAVNYYTVVVGAKNPLKDGSMHQVSHILIQPTPNSGSSNQSYLEEPHDLMKSWNSIGSEANVTGPSLALLRIEPGVDQGFLQLMESKTEWDGVDARIYCWALKKHERGPVMAATTAPAKRLRPADCKLKAYRIAENNSTICLSVNETSTTNITERMYSGCPVVVLQNGRPTLLAVALTDGTRPLLASPVAAEPWLLKHASVLEENDGAIN